ncbi:MAG: amino acid ABC transporter ATP-binding protein, partial [Pyramidobacter sp.]|nr:amino acid ABC transporter ATP-binding protein [Pyramidobacter sp.]
MIEIKNLKKQFGSLEVLKGVNLKIDDGEVVSIIGPSGSGKSTLLRCINLLEQPTSGQVIIDGQDITARGVNIQKVREEVGMVFQHFNLFRNKNVLQNMIYAPMKVRGLSEKDATEKAMQLLERVGLVD